MSDIKSITLRDDNDFRIVLSIKAPDKYSKRFCAELLTQAHDAYHKVWLQPRKTRFFLTKAEIDNLAQWLPRASSMLEQK